MPRPTISISPTSSRDLVSSTRWLTKTSTADVPYRWHGNEPPETPCVEWTGGKNGKGYGRVFLDGRNALAHRVALVAHLGRDLGPGLVADHLCEFPACVNPEHLQEVTQRENAVILSTRSITAVNAAATHCPRGHSLDEGNIPEAWKRRGGRGCRVCNRALAGGQQAVLAAVAKRLGVPKTIVRREVGSSSRALIELLGNPDGALIFAEGYARAEARALEALALEAVTA